MMLHALAQYPHRSNGRDRPGPRLPIPGLIQDINWAYIRRDNLVTQVLPIGGLVLVLWTRGSRRSSPGAGV
jgi:hypothetical protein